MTDTRESRRCPGCRIDLPVTDWPGGNPKYNASAECAQVAGELLGFEVEHMVELGHLHQLRIDAYGGQHVGEQTPSIGAVFALNGLYMFLERGSGSIDVRTAHGLMANSFSDWPALRPPGRVGELTAHDVLHAGDVRSVQNLMLKWAEQVWDSWPAADQELVRDLTNKLVPARYFRH